MVHTPDQPNIFGIDCYVFLNGNPKKSSLVLMGIIYSLRSMVLKDFETLYRLVYLLRTAGYLKMLFF